MDNTALLLKQQNGEVMKYVILGFICISALISGCATLPPVEPLSLNKNTISQQKQDIKIGIVSTKTPEISTIYPGAGCLLCLAVASGAHSGLSKHVKTLESDVPDLDNMLYEKIKDQGFDVKLITEEFKLSDASKIEVKKEQTHLARRDFRTLGKEHDVTHIIFIGVTHHGVVRNYSSYVPTSPPYASVTGSVYMVDLATNTYVWHNTINNKLNAEGAWKTPPSYPELTNAYYSVVESTKDSILEAFDLESVK